MAEKLEIERRIAEEKSNIAKRRSARASKRAKKASSARKQSTSVKASPGLNGHGQSKKPRKSKESAFRGEDDLDSEEDNGTINLTQKQELADKIQRADGDTLSEAIQIIQETTKLGSVSQSVTSIITG